MYFKAVSRAFGALSVLTLSAIAAPVFAQDSEAEELAARFGARPSVLDISLSPSGNKIAYISSDNATTELLYVVDLTSNPEPQLITSLDDANAELTSCNWANDVWLVCNVLGMSVVDGQTPIYISRLLSVATDGSKPNLLTSRDSTRARGIQQNGGRVLALDVEGEENRILVTRQFLEGTALGTRLGNADPGLGVEMIDVTKNRRRTVEKPDEEASRYVADENGEIRVKVRSLMDTRGQLAGEYRYFYRKPDSDKWEPFAEDLSSFRPVNVSAKDNIAYGYMRKDGVWALYGVPLDGTGEVKEVAARGDVDADGLLTIGRKQRAVGVSWATEKRQVEYFDSDLAKLARGLQNALPGKPLISIIDASADENTLLIVASSDVDPGMTYLLERDTKALSPLLPLRDPLVERQMAPMKPINFSAADGTEIPGYLTLPLGADGPVPAIVLPHGGPGSRDYWGFDWMVQFFAARGYAVLQPNFRGSAGYGEAWFGRNGFKAWDVAIGDVNDAGRWLVKEGIANPDRMGIVGWSYGGYAALQSQVVDPDLYKSVVAIAPVTDLRLTIEEARDYTNFQVTREFIGEGPHLKEGSPANFAERFKAPVLLFHGTLDMNVGYLQSRRMEDRLQDAGHPVKYVEYEGFDHFLDHGQVRGNMLLAIDNFLTEHLGE
ncbi:S9 family peptidase [Erythrobacter sp. WH158]|uniref:S9 family peptidase n=2 Tax=Erythrobacter crassostreae TaxID=2828328 RepID=A0A9X1F5X7_9SPHN|nr:S9 family peptidase [Erythrobacter crassostrea]